MLTLAYVIVVEHSANSKYIETDNGFVFTIHWEIKVVHRSK